MYRYKRLTFIILPLMYTAGVIGLQIPETKALFQMLTPFNLATSLLLLLWFHNDYNTSFVRYALLAFIIGFGIEVIGVKTGAIFGHYWYGPVLGTSLWGVPLLIGCNWLILNYCTDTIIDKIKVPILPKIIIAAFLMTAIDVLIEPVAMHQNFWQWQNDYIPLQNYIGWFVGSATISTIYFFSKFERTNELAPLLLLLQILLFFINYLIINV